MFIQNQKEKMRGVIPKKELDVLWIEFRKGREDALAELFKASYLKLFNYGFNIYPNDAHIKDAVQELFLTLWEKRKSINDARSVMGYLFSSLRRIIMKSRMRNDRQTLHNFQYIKSIRKEYNIEETLINYETEIENKKRVTRSFDLLTTRQKEAIYLKYYSGLSNLEIAQKMEINTQSLYNIVSKAIYRIRKEVPLSS